MHIPARAIVVDVALSCGVAGGAMARAHYRPFLKTVAATLLGSSEILARNATGSLSPEAGDRIMQDWQRRVFAAGEGDVVGVDVERYRDAAPPVCRPYVVMTNHQSLLDIPSVVATWPGRIRMVSKMELSRVPVWGPAMRALGIVFVDRGDRAQSIRALDAAKAQLAAGTSIWMAPEGTRSRDGELGPLKKGGFHLARALGVPIAPAWIEGTARIVSPHSFAVQPGGRVVVSYGAPIPTEGRDVGDLVAEVRAALLSLRRRSRSTTTTAPTT
jgi:1-acyl-sn-glycerol-3-phosphate acyltransferase